MASRPGIAARDDAVNQVLREGGDGVRDLAPLELQRHARDFPCPVIVSLPRETSVATPYCPMRLRWGERVPAGREFSRESPSPRDAMCGTFRAMCWQIWPSVSDALVAEARSVGALPTRRNPRSGERHGANIPPLQAPMRARTVADSPAVFAHRIGRFSRSPQPSRRWLRRLHVSWRAGFSKSAREPLPRRLARPDAMVDLVGCDAASATQFDDGEAQVAGADR